MIAEDGMQDDFGVQEVGAQDGIDAGEGAAEVLSYQIRGDAAGEGSAAIQQGGRSLAKGVTTRFPRCPAYTRCRWTC